METILSDVAALEPGQGAGTPPVFAPSEVREFVRDLTVEGLSRREINEALEEKKMDGILDFLEIQDATENGKIKRGMLPNHPSYTLPRIVGIVAICMGLGSILLLITSETTTSRSLPYLSIISLTLGCVLVWNPGSARNDVL